MKNNLISSIASWKSAALLGLVALIATVAFSGVLSTTKIASAETTIVTSEGATLTEVTPGGKFYVQTSNVSSSYAAFTIDSSSVGTASFATGGQTLLCKDATNAAQVATSRCDKDAASGNIRVQVNVDSGSPDGPIVVESRAYATNTKEQAVVEVNSGLTPTSFAVKATDPAIKIDTDPNTTGNQAGTTTITATVKNNKATGLENQVILFSVTGGLLNCGGDDVVACSSSTGSTGAATATLKAGGQAGTATVTATHTTTPTLSGTASVVVFGNAAKISASADDSAVEIGGGTFVVVTVTDSGGNPVPGVTFDVTDDVTTNDVVVTGPSDPSVPMTASVSVDRNLPGAANDIPACNDDNTGHRSRHSRDPGVVHGGRHGRQGPVCHPGDGPAERQPRPQSHARRPHHHGDSERGGEGVGDGQRWRPGATSITDNAPDRVDALSETPIKVNVWDDTDVPVGSVTFSAIKIAGDGVLLGAPKTTTDGEATFTLIAPTSGTVIIRIAAGAPGAQITSSISIGIGEAAPAATWSSTPGSGWSNVLLAGC